MNKHNALLVYKMAWAKCSLMSVGAAMGAFTTAMSGVSWSGLSPTQQICVIFGCLGATVLVIVAFLDRTIQRIEGEQQQIPGTPEHAAALASETSFLTKAAREKTLLPSGLEATKVTDKPAVP